MLTEGQCIYIYIYCFHASLKLQVDPLRDMLVYCYKTARIVMRLISIDSAENEVSLADGYIIRMIRLWVDAD
jgi:hypothetical protein